MANSTLSNSTSPGGTALKLVIDAAASANLPLTLTGDELVTIQKHLKANARTDVDTSNTTALKSYLKARNSHPHSGVADERFSTAGDTNVVHEEVNRRAVFSSLATAVGSFRLSSELVKELSFLIT